MHKNWGEGGGKCIHPFAVWCTKQGIKNNFINLKQFLFFIKVQSAKIGVGVSILSTLAQMYICSDLYNSVLLVLHDFFFNFNEKFYV